MAQTVKEKRSPQKNGKERVQLMKGLMEVYILDLTAGGKQYYGMELTAAAEKRGLPLPAGTLYPVLSRMVNKGFIVSEWSTTNAGHPRKYIRITEAGERELAQLKKKIRRMVRIVGC